MPIGAFCYALLPPAPRAYRRPLQAKPKDLGTEKHGGVQRFFVGFASSE